jgi:hypothetical protein
VYYCESRNPCDVKERVRGLHFYTVPTTHLKRSPENHKKPQFRHGFQSRTFQVSINQVTTTSDTMIHVTWFDSYFYMQDAGIQDLKFVFNNTRSVAATVIVILHYVSSMLFSFSSLVVATTNEKMFFTNNLHCSMSINAQKAHTKTALKKRRAVEFNNSINTSYIRVRNVHRPGTKINANCINAARSG